MKSIDYRGAKIPATSDTLAIICGLLLQERPGYTGRYPVLDEDGKTYDLPAEELREIAVAMANALAEDRAAKIAERKAFEAAAARAALDALPPLKIGALQNEWETIDAPAAPAPALDVAPAAPASDLSALGL
jgi:hypothetical protein